MRARNLKPGFFKNETLASIHPFGRILFEGLWCLCDREGKLEDRPMRIKAEILPYDLIDIEELLTTLDNNKFIKRYEVNGNKYIQILNFLKHQTPHWQEKPSSIPSLNSTKRKPRVIQDKSKSNPSSLLNPSLLNPESLLSMFEVFWKAYPKKKSKGDARKAWKKIKPDEILFKNIMETLGKLISSEAWVKECGKYIPYPSTWLNSEGWEDETEITITPKEKKDPPKIECKFCGVVHLVKEEHRCE